MKKGLCLILILLLVICVCASCSPSIYEEPDDMTLEFWIAQDVSSVDFSEYHEIVGWFGARQYYGKGYYPTEVFGENGEIHYVEPTYYVKYLVGAYPDESDGGQFVTRIDITDPDVTVYGISCNSSFEEFETAMEKLGCEITESTNISRVATLDKVRFHLLATEITNQLTISVEVTNKYGICY